MKTWEKVYDRVVTPLMIWPIIRGNTVNMKKSFGQATKELIAEFIGRRTIFWLPREEELKFSRQVFVKTFGQPKTVRRVRKEVERDIKNLLNLAQTIKGKNLKKLSSKQLGQLHWRYVLYYSNILNYGLFTTYSATLNDEALKVLKSKFPAANASAYFTLLTTPRKETPHFKEEKTLLALAVLIAKNPSLKRLFRLSPLQIEHKIKLYPKIKNAFNRLVANFGWLKINYENQPRHFLDFVKIIKNILKDHPQPQRLLNSLLVKKKQIISRQKRLEKKNIVGKKYIDLFRAIREYGFLREYRKARCIYSIYLTNFLREEIARRLRLKVEELKYLFPQEINKYLEAGRVDKKMIKARQKYFVSYYHDKQSDIMTGDRARAFMRKISFKKVKERFNLEGLPVCPGRVRGRVRIIRNFKDLSFFQKGEIFTSQATSPDFIGTLRKAAGIITNEGGMTSHAAIISRELNIPCLVGVKGVTKTLKTGERIELDAEQGLINKLNKKI